MRDFPLIGPTALCVWLALRLSRNRRKSDAALLGIALGVSLMIKFTAVIFLALPVGSIFVHSFVTGKTTRLRTFILWSVTALCATVVAGPWYFTSAVFREVGHQVIIDPVHLSYGSVLPYHLGETYLGWVPLVLGIAGLLILAAKKEYRSTAWLLFCWGWLPLLFIESLPHREPRHMIIGIAPIAMAFPLGIFTLARKRIASVGMIVITGIFLLLFLNRSMNEFFYIHSTGVPLPTQPSCLKHYSATCEALNKLSETWRNGERKMSVGLHPGSKADMCVYEESLMLCERQSQPTRWRMEWFVMRPMVEVVRIPEVDVWISIEEHGEGIPGLESGWLVVKEFPVACKDVLKIQVRETDEQATP